MRRSGLLLHVTSLPSRFGIGDLGPEAIAFADFLKASGQTLWQMLPVNPVDGACGNSPYSSISAFAGNTLLISPERMCEDGLVERSDIESAPRFQDGRSDYDGAGISASRFSGRRSRGSRRTGVSVKNFRISGSA